MERHCGVFRTADDLQTLKEKLRGPTAPATPGWGWPTRAAYNLDLVEALELGHMLDVCAGICEGALARQESRGGPLPGRLPQPRRPELAQAHPGLPRARGGITRPTSRCACSPSPLRPSPGREEVLGVRREGTPLPDRAHREPTMEEVNFTVLRHDPASGQKPRYQDYPVKLTRPGMMVLDGLNQIRWEQDGTLAYRRSCREGVCGSDGLNLNGMNLLSCITHIEAVAKNGRLVVQPLPGLPLVKDLVVDVSDFLAKYFLVKPYLIAKTRPARSAAIPRRTQEARRLYECILCACCSSACPSYWPIRLPGSQRHAQRLALHQRQPRRGGRGAPGPPCGPPRRLALPYHPQLPGGLPQGAQPTKAIAASSEPSSSAASRPPMAAPAQGQPEAPHLRRRACASWPPAGVAWRWSWRSGPWWRAAWPPAPRTSSPAWRSCSACPTWTSGR